MRPINDPRVTLIDGLYFATCACGHQSFFPAKAQALRLVQRGSCRHCKKDYRIMKGHVDGLYKNQNGKWCSTCSGCGKEQAYTRRDHAKQSTVAGWRCKPCTALEKGFSANRPVGDNKRLYNRFFNSAKDRRVEWSISEEEMFETYTGRCKLTGWDISTKYDNCTASLDRIDNSKGYVKGNIQWVHVMVNMCRNKYPLEDFLRMCKSVTDNILLRHG